MSGILNNFYADDQKMVNVFKQLLTTTDSALTQASRALGPGSRADVDNLNSASAVLQTYASVFSPQSDQLEQLADMMQQTAASLR